MSKHQVIIRLAVLSLLLLAVGAQAQRAYKVDIVRDTFRFGSLSKKSVSLDDLHQGCPERDCIPSIDNPKYVAAVDATHVADDDIVIAVSIGDEHRAYPARILDHHEIVNDTIAGEPVAITWCPLCGSAVGVRREIGGKITEFGVSGVLYNSDLVFYDRETETLWDQVEARGIVGPLTGEVLELVPVTMTRWSRWRGAHPDTLVLSEDTGFAEDYSTDHYGKYRESDRIVFPVNTRDKSVHPKSVVFGFSLDGGSVAYTESLLQKHGTYRHELDGVEHAVTLRDDGTVVLQRGESTASLVPIRLYWFAWYTFHPKTQLFQ
jgi:hypothetical protein